MNGNREDWQNQSICQEAITCNNSISTLQIKLFVSFKCFSLNFFLTFPSSPRAQIEIVFMMVMFQNSLVPPQFSLYFNSFSFLIIFHALLTLRDFFSGFNRTLTRTRIYVKNLMLKHEEYAYLIRKKNKNIFLHLVLSLFSFLSARIGALMKLTLHL